MIFCTYWHKTPWVSLRSNSPMLLDIGSQFLDLGLPILFTVIYGMSRAFFMFPAAIGYSRSQDWISLAASLADTHRFSLKLVTGIL